MTIDGKDLLESDLGRPVVFTPAGDPGRAPELGLVARWDRELVYVRFRT